jgi:hypothetical protein
MKKITTKSTIIGCALLFTLTGILYTFFAPKVYSSKSHVALFRLKIEDPDSALEESRNRWIWIRDGLNLKSALFTEDMLTQLIAKDETARLISSNFPNKHIVYEYFKTFLNIQFTGADENNFLVEVKAPNAKLAFNLNQLVFDRLKYLAVNSDKFKFENVLTTLKQKQKENKKDQAIYAYYKDKITKLTFNNVLEQQQRENSFEVISPPLLNEVPIWPRGYLIIVLSAVIGLVFGAAIDFAAKSLKLN